VKTDVINDHSIGSLTCCRSVVAETLVMQICSSTDKGCTKPQVILVLNTVGNRTFHVIRIVVRMLVVLYSHV